MAKRKVKTCDIPGLLGEEYISEFSSDSVDISSSSSGSVKQEKIICAMGPSLLDH
jgi:hypothetical protein